MAWTTPRTWTDTELVTASIMNTHVRDNLNALGPRLIVTKAVDESVTSSTVLQDDDHLQFAIGASEAWSVSLVLGLPAAPGGIKIALTAPSGAAGWWALRAIDGTGYVFEGAKMSSTFVDGDVTGTATVAGTITVQGYCLNSTTPGTFKLRWAQSSSNGTPSTLKRGSTLEYVKVI